MKFNDISEYDGDYGLVKFIDPDHPDDPPLVGVAIDFGGKWKEPYKANEYVNNFGKALKAISFINLNDLVNHLET